MESKIRDYYRYVDLEKWDSLFSLFSNEIVYNRPGHPPIVGIDNFRHFFLHVRTIKSSKHTLLAVVSNGYQVAVHGMFRGMMKDGTSAEFGFADFFEFSHDKISKRYSFTTLGKV